MLIDFGTAVHVEVLALGQPGQRTFYLRLLDEGDHSAALKIEKEHLMGLRTALQEILDQSGFRGEPRAGGVVYFPATAQYEFPVGQLGVGYSPADETIVMEAREIEVGDDRDIGIVRVRVTRDRGATLVQQLDETIRTGRPLCALCGQPIDPEGHTCPRSNGHSRQAIPEAGQEDDE